MGLIDRYSNTHGLMLGEAQIAAYLEYDLTLVTYTAKDFWFIANLKMTVPPFPEDLAGKSDGRQQSTRLFLY